MSKETFELRRIVAEIDELGLNLTHWEIQFISGLIDRSPVFYTQKQIEIIYRIYEEKC